MQLIPINEMQIMAEAIATSGLFGLKTPQQALALGLLCQAEGRHPAEAARDYHVIQGRPTLKADTMLSRFQQAGGRVEWTVYTDVKVAGVFSHPQGGTLTLDWDMDRAKAAGLTGRDVWRQYPRQMLRARLISEAIRTILPGVLSGCYLPDEVADMPVTVTTETVTVAVPALTEPVRVVPHPALEKIETASNMDELRVAWQEALASRPSEAELVAMTAAKDQRKEKLK